MLRRVVAEANLEAERALFVLRGGAYVIPAAAIAARGAVTATIVRYAREPTRTAAR